METSGSVDAVHDLRVASRRLAGMETWMRRADAADLLERIKAVRKAFGPVRDADVQIELLSSYLEGGENGWGASSGRAGAWNDERLVMAALLANRLRRRARSLEKGLGRLAGEPRRELERRLEALRDMEPASSGEVGSGQLESRPWALVHATLPAVRSSFARLAGLGTGHTRWEVAHALRIAVKALRYSCEAAGCESGSEPVLALKACQETLGQAQDRVVLLGRLQSRMRNDWAVSERLRAGCAALATRLGKEIEGLVDAALPELESALARVAEALPPSGF